jgi:hypothetical protein
MSIGAERVAMEQRLAAFGMTAGSASGLHSGHPRRRTGDGSTGRAGALRLLIRNPKSAIRNSFVAVPATG